MGVAQGRADFHESDPGECVPKVGELPGALKPQCSVGTKCTEKGQGIVDHACPAPSELGFRMHMKTLMKNLVPRALQPHA